MTKENIEKITTPFQSLDAKDISVEEKKSLSDFMQAKGFSAATFYLRFFKNGFSAWEIIGINECKKQFLAMPEIAELFLCSMLETKRRETLRAIRVIYTSCPRAIRQVFSTNA